MKDRSIEAVLHYERGQYGIDLGDADRALRCLEEEIGYIRLDISEARESGKLPERSRCLHNVEKLNHFAQCAMEEMLSAQNHADIARTLESLKDE